MEPKTFLRRVRKVQATRTTVDQQTDVVLKELHRRMEAIGYEDKPDAECFARLQEQLGGFVEAQLEHLDGKLEERRRLLHDAPMMRERRDELTAELYDTMVSLRGTIRSTFGAGYEKQLFGTGKTPRDPFTLAKLAGEIARSLRNPELQKQLSGSPFAQFDWDVAADDLGQKAVRLEEVLHDLDENAAGQTSAVRRKDQAAEDFDRTQKGMFKVLEGLMEMVGMDDVARQLRPTVPAKRGASADEAMSEIPEAVKQPRERKIEAAVAPRDTDRDEIAAAAGSDSTSEPSPPPLRLVESASEADSAAPGAIEWASEAGITISDPPAATKARERPSSGRLRASTHPVRTASDPPGAASHPGFEDTEEVEIRRHAV